MLDRKILVVDDSNTVRTILSRALTDAGYTVITAANGKQAIEVARAEKPRLAILDINMPLLDGYGVCQQLKRMGEPWTSIPIVFLTTVESHALEMLGDAMGAYLHKPVCQKELLRVVGEFLAPNNDQVVA